MLCTEIEQDLNLKIQNVSPKAKRPKKNNMKKNIPTHPMTMPLKRLVIIQVGEKSLWVVTV